MKTIHNNPTISFLPFAYRFVVSSWQTPDVVVEVVAAAAVVVWCFSSSLSWRYSKHCDDS